jgi:hypothetical protein
MMTKAIAALIIAGFLFGGWHLFLYWERVKNEEHVKRKEAAQAGTVGQRLPGLPHGLEASLNAAQQRGAEGLGAWLKSYGANVEDPRKAWIELDYVMLLSREKPAEARRVFASVKARVREGSPVYPRIKQLEKTYE